MVVDIIILKYWNLFFYVGFRFFILIMMLLLFNGCINLVFFLFKLFDFGIFIFILDFYKYVVFWWLIYCVYSFISVVVIISGLKNGIIFKVKNLC